MSVWLRLSAGIDAVNRRVGRSTVWLILLAVLISTGNALVRKFAGASSNALLEVQWYLYGGAFMLAAAYTLQVNEHVRIDVVSLRLPMRVRVWIDIVALIACALPLCVLMVWFGGEHFWQAFESGETSYNAGGLIRWPAYLMTPLGFFLLALQCVSELIKRVAWLRGARASAFTVESDLPPFTPAALREGRS